MVIRIPPWAKPRHGRLPGDPEPEQALVVPGALPPSMTEAVPEYTAPDGNVPCADCGQPAGAHPADIRPAPDRPAGEKGARP